MQAPFTQSWPLEHEEPQRPQAAVSRVVSTQRPLQERRGAVQVTGPVEPPPPPVEPVPPPELGLWQTPRRQLPNGPQLAHWAPLTPQLLGWLAWHVPLASQHP